MAFLTVGLGGVFGLQASGATITEVYPFQGFFNPSTLLQAADGNFYGTVGGSVNTGLLFRVTSDGVFTAAAGFTVSNASPFSGGPLVQDTDGALYGTAYGGGGPSRYGTVFRLTAGGELSRLAVFDGTNGATPTAGLARGPDGYFYGTTQFGGPSFKPSTPHLSIPGTVFRISTNGELTTLVAFNNTNGARPNAPLLLGADSAFYGTTSAGGSNGAGTIFRMTTNGELTTLFAFGVTTGISPFGGLVQHDDGSFYGTTTHGGANGYGTVFRLLTNGDLITLASFGGTNGAHPYGGLVKAIDGSFYGTTIFGGLGFDGSNTNGNSGYGVVFRVTQNDEFTPFALFSGTNGYYAKPTLVQATDGYLYGTTTSGGSYSNGTIYRVAILPTIRIEQVNGTVTLAWNALIGKAYQLQEASFFGEPNWNDFGGIIIATNSIMRISLIAGDDSEEFYRFVQLP